MKNAARILAAILVFGAPAFAGVVYEIEDHGPLHEPGEHLRQPDLGGRPSPQDRRHHRRRRPGSRESIYRSDRKEMVIVNDKDKTYIVLRRGADEGARSSDQTGHVGHGSGLHCGARRPARQDESDDETAHASGDGQHNLPSEEDRRNRRHQRLSLRQIPVWRAGALERRNCGSRHGRTSRAAPTPSRLSRTCRRFSRRCSTACRRSAIRALPTRHSSASRRSVGCPVTPTAPTMGRSKTSPR